MCGIAGTIGVAPVMQKRILALLNQSRGRDSVGMMSDFRCCRIAESIGEAILQDRLPSWAWAGNNVWAVHTRASSPNMGGISKETTHPFTYGKWTAAHNGYIRNWKSIVETHKEEHPEVDKFKVDSMTIPFVLEKYGLDGLKKLSGSAAVWFFDVEDKKNLYLWINEQDLSLFVSKELISFSSDGDHLKLAGFPKKGTIKLKDDGQLLKINIEEKEIENLGAYEGLKYEIVTHTATKWSYNGGEGYFPFTGDRQPWKGMQNGNLKDYTTLKLRDVPAKHFTALSSKIREWGKCGSLRFCPSCNDLVVEMSSDIDTTFLLSTATKCSCGGDSTLYKGDVEEFIKKMNTETKEVEVSGVKLDLRDPTERKLAIIHYINTEPKIHFCFQCNDFVLPEDFNTKPPVGIQYLSCPICHYTTNSINTNEKKNLDKALELWDSIWLENKSFEECEHCNGTGTVYNIENGYEEVMCEKCFYTGIKILKESDL